MYFIWAGTTNANAGSGASHPRFHPLSDENANEDAEKDGAAVRYPVMNESDGISVDAIVQQGRLGVDWACSMGSRNVG